MKKSKHILEHLPLLLRVGRRLTKNEADAEDLAQDTLTRALSRMDELRDKNKSRAWLLTIQRSIFLNQRRGPRARFEVLEGGLGDPIQPEPSGNLESEILSHTLDDELHAALEALPENWREAVLLRELEELSYAEIAQIQNCPIGTVRSRLARARQTLQQDLLRRKHESA